MNDSYFHYYLPATNTSTITVLITGCVTVVLVSALLVVQRERTRRQQFGSNKSKRDSTSDDKATTSGSRSSQAIDKTKFPGGQVTIYYATQTGTSESFAQELEREGPDHGFLIRVVDLEDVVGEDVEQFLLPGGATARAIILAATYGEGEPTDNSNEIVQMLKEKMEDESSSSSSSSSAGNILQGLEFCVFGLGNRQYEHYNAMGKFFDQALETLGGQRILPLGLGDDDADLEGDFESWKDQMWTAFKDKYCKGAVIPNKTKQSEGGASEGQIKLPPCEYAIEYHDTSAKATSTDRHKVSLDHVHGSGRNYFTSIDCPVTTVKELRSPQDGGSTKHIEIDISNTPNNFTYMTADNLGVLPINQTLVVETVAKALGYDLEAVFSLKAAPGHEWHGNPFPMPLTVRECLTRYLDLTSAPRRSDLKLLTQYATDKLDRQALLRLSSKEGKQEYKEKIMQGFVGMVDLLKLCPSLQIPLEHFISICHFLLPRYYTIASSSSVHPKSVHLTVAVTQDQRKDGTIFQGVCSTHLAECKAGGGGSSSSSSNSSSNVRIILRPSTFRLPQDASRPILMIGPGTGVAPMRALLQERYHQQTVEKKNVGPNVLYFGCKQRELDYLYQEELEAWREDGSFLNLHVAFSRETPGKKVYVQHLLLQNASETWKLIHDDQASIYVCGGVKMGHDVTEALKEIAVQHGQMSFDQAKDYLGKLASQGRFVQELWA